MGWNENIPIAEKYQVPIVITGFEPLDILDGILHTVQQLESGRHEVENRYARIVEQGGNQPAQDLIRDVFALTDRKWRGIGKIPVSGFRIAEKYAAYDASLKFRVSGIKTEEPEICISGVILQGLKKPFDCPAFGKECTPQTPLGATMVSSEGACAAYYLYQRISE